MQTNTPDTPMTPWGRVILVCLLYAAFYILLKLPLLHIPILYYDDGETLYRAFSILEGRIPYRDDISHHFFGYTLIFVLLGKFFGISLSLIWLGALINQTLLALGVFLLSARVISARYAFLIGLTALSAWEPWVPSFFPLYQLSLALIWCLYAACLSIQSGRLRPLIVASLIAGIGFIIDQRGLFLIAIPLVACWYRRSLLAHKKTYELFGIIITFCLPILAVAAWLFLNDALKACIEQTFIFPTQFRSLRSSLSEKFLATAFLQRHLIIDSPILFALMLWGVFGAFVRWKSLQQIAQIQIILTVTAVFLATGISALGGRDLNYYTLCTLPLMALLGSYAGILPIFKHQLGKTLFATILLTAPLLALLQSAQLYKKTSLYKGDGIQQVSEFLKSRLRPEDSLYVWAYRPDLYVAAQKLSALPFVSRILIHPDGGVTDPKEREAHVYPLYEEKFMRKFTLHPPRYLVTFNRVETENNADLSSRADQFIQAQIPYLYTEILRQRSADLLGRQTEFIVYQRKENVLNGIHSTQ